MVTPRQFFKLIALLPRPFITSGGSSSPSGDCGRAPVWPPPRVVGRSPDWTGRRGRGLRRVRPLPSISPGPVTEAFSSPSPQMRLLCQWLWPKSW